MKCNNRLVRRASVRDRQLPPFDQPRIDEIIDAQFTSESLDDLINGDVVEFNGTGCGSACVGLGICRRVQSSNNNNGRNY